MPKKFENVYQFKITLKDSNPEIWRRIQVPEYYTFWDLHVAIQDAMGWDDCHLHEFIAKPPLGKGINVRIGIPDGEYDKKVQADWNVLIAAIFALVDEVVYWYDFGDDWMHSVKLEEIIPAVANKDYPVCIDGERACPPEDSHGVHGYSQLLKVFINPKDPEHEDIKEWLGEDFDPEHFDCNEVQFDDPNERRKEVGMW